jgi:predicted alpha/beta hydrolase
MIETLTLTSADQHSFDAAIYATEGSAAPLLIFFSALGTPAKVYRRLVELNLLATIAGMRQRFPQSPLGLGGRGAATLMRDWSRVAQTGEYRPLGSQADYKQLMAELKMPVLALTFAGDSWSPAPAAKALLDKLPERSVVHRHLSAADAEGVSLDHYSWLKQPALVAPAVAQFIGRSHEGHVAVGHSG